MKFMKMKSVVLILMLAATLGSAQTNSLTSLLQQGLLEEQANRNLDAAIANYQSLATQFDKDRKLAATAVFRIGECYRMQGQTNEAAAQYQRILKDFSDQQTLATLSRQNLTGMGMAQTDDQQNSDKNLIFARLSQARATEQASTESSIEIRALASQIAGIEKLKSDTVECGQAVQAIFPDEGLKEMLILIPKLQKQEADLTADPQLFDVYAQNGFKALAAIGSRVRHYGDATNLLAEFHRQTVDQLAQISQRVDFILEIQKARLKVLQSAAGVAASPDNSDAQLWNSLKGLSSAELEKVLPTIIPDNTLTKLLQQRDEAEIELAQKLIDYSPSNTVVLRIKALDEALDLQISEKIDGMMQALKMRAAIASSASSQTSSPGSSDTTDEEDQEIRRIQQMIRNSPDLINAATGPGGTTPLQKAAFAGWLKVATFLLDHGADVNLHQTGNAIISQGSAGFTALHQAAAAGNRAMVELLLSRGADVNAKDSLDKTPLHIAADKGFSAVMEVLLSHQADVNARENYGRTPLIWAAWQNRPGNGKIIERLLKYKPDLDVADQSGATALLNAAAVGSPEAVKLLLAAGANPNVANNDGRTPLSYIAAKGVPEMVKLLLTAHADPNGGKNDAPLLWAIQNKNITVAEILLSAGANPNVKVEVNNSFYVSGRGFATPLGLAVSVDQLSIVQLLLKHKVVPDDSKIKGKSLLFSALDDTNILEALLAAGAAIDPTTRDEANWTPLAAAVSQKNLPAMAILLKHGANPNIHNSNGATPLYWAAGRLADTNIFQLLLDYKANPNVRASNGQTPLDSLKICAARTTETAETRTLAGQLADFLRQHGALDKLPDWDRIIISRPSANFSQPIFYQGTNGWNQFTLLEAILNCYGAGRSYSIPQGNTIRIMNSGDEALPFPDLSRVTIRRPSHGSTNEMKMVINLLNSTNGIDMAKDVPLEFGDVVEIAERDHALGDKLIGLTDSQRGMLFNYMKGNVRLTVQGRTAGIEIYHCFGSGLQQILGRSEARELLLSSSDLSKVKTIRTDLRTGKKQEWVLDCSPSPTDGSVNIAPTVLFGSENQPDPSSFSDLWLRDGDVIEVPERH